MSRPQAASQDRRRAAFRPALIVAAIAAALTPGLAPAVSFVWGSDVAAYNAFAATCPAAGGAGCPVKPQPNAGILFSWGTDTSTASNSVYSWQNTGAEFVLDKISISATATGVGSGALGILPGRGAAPVWEWSQYAADTQFGQSRMQITVGTNAAQSLGLISQTPSTSTWYDTGNTLATPIGVTFSGGSGLTVKQNDFIQFRLYETLWNGAPQDQPDLVFAPMTIDIQPPASTLSAGSVVGNVRMGTEGPMTATITNAGAVAANDVSLSAVAAPFGPTSAQPSVPVPIAANNGTGTGSFTYKPQYVAGALVPTTDDTTVNVTSSNAGTAAFTMTGHGVGPVFDLSGDGVSGLSVDLGSVEVGKTTLYNLALSNLFATDLGLENALGDLTIINVGLSDPLGPVKVQGLPNTWFVIHSKGAGGGPDAFSLAFTPTSVGAITPLLLTFGTDVNGPLYNPGTPTTPTTYYEVRITGIGVAAPVPATLALCGLGLVLLGRRRR